MVSFFCRFVASLRGHVAAVYRISWSSDSRMLVSASKDSTLKVSAHSLQSRMSTACTDLYSDLSLFSFTCSLLASLLLRTSLSLGARSFNSFGISRLTRSALTSLGTRTKSTASISLPIRLLVEVGTRRSRCELLSTSRAELN